MVEQRVSETKMKPEIVVPQPLEKPAPPPEYGGRKGLEPTRYGDWENNGKCVDF